jgi:hypothetical protein
MDFFPLNAEFQCDSIYSCLCSNAKEILMVLREIVIKASKEYNHVQLIVKMFYAGEKMKYPIRNLIYEKIRQEGTMTDADLVRDLAKDGITLAESAFNKTLLDLEIYGLVRVSWMTKDKRRIELIANSDNPS